MEYHIEKRAYLPPASKCTVVVENALRVEVAFEYKLTEHSSLRQVVQLDACGRMLVFDTSVDWHEKHKCLKVEFPVTIRAHEARYHTQYGIVSRPTHRNTSWDVAKFEVCGCCLAPEFEVHSLLFSSSTKTTKPPHIHTYTTRDPRSHTHTHTHTHKDTSQNMLKTPHSTPHFPTQHQIHNAPSPTQHTTLDKRTTTQRTTLAFTHLLVGMWTPLGRSE
jgi:Glycosyl hydrolases family 38 C-terminal domain